MSGLPEPEVYTPERIAEFLLNNSVSEEDYRRNLAEVWPSVSTISASILPF